MTENKEYEIKLDYDSDNIPINRIMYVTRYLGLYIKECRVRKTKHGFHFTLKVLSKLDFEDKDICLMQALMGSDFRREFLNYLRILNEVERWNVLYKWKMRNGEVISEEVKNHITDKIEELVVEASRLSGKGP